MKVFHFIKCYRASGRRLLALLTAVFLAGASICLPQTALLSGKDRLSVHAASASDKPEPDVDTVIRSVRSYMLSVDKDPNEGSIWNLLGMARSGLTVPASYVSTCYKNILAFLEENDWQITRAKYTEYSKLILGLTAVGVDASDLNGHNLLAYLSDMKTITRQGFNGPIWALIALNAHPSYVIPLDDKAEEQVTEEGLITYLLEGEVKGGGWTLYGDIPDSDITGMTIQALAPYYGKRDDVTKAVDRAVNWLSENQMEDGGFGTLSGDEVIPTSESVSQVVTALSMIGVDCSTDKRFIKNGNSPLHALWSYYLEPGGFMHVKEGAENNGGGEAGTINGLATEQGMYAAVAYSRLIKGKTSLFDNSDLTLTVCDQVYQGSGDFLGKDESSDGAGGQWGSKAPDETSGNTSSEESTGGRTEESVSASDQAESGAEGWSFSGDDYVPDENAQDSQAETGQASASNPVFYILGGLILIGGIAAVLLAAGKKKTDQDKDNQE